MHSFGLCSLMLLVSCIVYTSATQDLILDGLSCSVNTNSGLLVCSINYHFRTGSTATGIAIFGNANCAPSGGFYYRSCHVDTFSGTGPISVTIPTFMNSDTPAQEPSVYAVYGSDTTTGQTSQIVLFKYTAFAIGSCSAACGGGAQTYEYHCTGFDGLLPTVSGSVMYNFYEATNNGDYCQFLTKPSSYGQACNTQACQVTQQELFLDSISCNVNNARDYDCTIDYHILSGSSATAVAIFGNSDCTSHGASSSCHVDTYSSATTISFTLPSQLRYNTPAQQPSVYLVYGSDTTVGQAWQIQLIKYMPFQGQCSVSCGGGVITTQYICDTFDGLFPIDPGTLQPQTDYYQPGFTAGVAGDMCYFVSQPAATTAACNTQACPTTPPPTTAPPPTTQPPPTLPPLITTQSNGTLVYVPLGCYYGKDSNGVSAIADTLDTTAMTKGKCASLAAAKGYNIFGIVAGAFCHGGLNSNYTKNGNSSSCTIPCGGDSSTGCGGGGTGSPTSVYRLYSYMGCYNEFNSNHSATAFPAYLAYGDPNLTIDKCGGLATASGYNTFGIAAGAWCEAGLSPAYSRYGANSACNTQCVGPGGGYGCGGSSGAISVYTLYPPVPIVPTAQDIVLDSISCAFITQDNLVCILTYHFRAGSAATGIAVFGDANCGGSHGLFTQSCSAKVQMGSGSIQFTVIPDISGNTPAQEPSVYPVYSNADTTTGLNYQTPLFAYKPFTTGSCSATCGGGTQTSQYYCDTYDGIVQMYKGSPQYNYYEASYSGYDLCYYLTRPSSTTHACNTQACPTTQAPSTSTPTTQVPTTIAPTTVAPTTIAATTPVPTTTAPTTTAPTTTVVVTTQVPTTTSTPTTTLATTTTPTTIVPTTVLATTTVPTTVTSTTTGVIINNNGTAVSAATCSVGIQFLCDAFNPSSIFLIPTITVLTLVTGSVAVLVYTVSPRIATLLGYSQLHSSPTKVVTGV